MINDTLHNAAASTVRLVIPAVLLLFFSSCAPTTTQYPPAAESNKLALDPAPLPRYQVGTTFVYSNGTWETVAEVESDEVVWVNHRNDRSAGSPDFTYKRSRWQTRDRHGSRAFSQTTFLLEDATTTLWPLKPGNTTRFDEYGRWYTESGDERRYDTYWSCQVLGTERVSVAAGDFDTWKITCRRYPDRFSTARKTREYRTWYYAPSINHWVVEERDYNGYRENRRIELAAVLPDLGHYTALEEHIASLRKQFQNTLESGRRETTVVWKDRQERLEVSLTPKRTFRDEIGGFCRQYQQVIVQTEHTYQYPGIACRSDDGLWRVPRR